MSVDATITKPPAPPAPQATAIGDNCGRCKFAFRNLQGQMECRRQEQREGKRVRILGSSELVYDRRSRMLYKGARVLAWIETRSDVVVR